MAAVYRRPGSPFWFACYPDRNGKTVRRTTKSTDRAVAAGMVLEWERVEFAAREGHASVAAFQKVVTEVSERVIGESLRSQTVWQYFEEWIASIGRKNSAGTVERYRNTVRLFLFAIDKVADQSLRSLTPRHIDIFLNRRLDKGAAPKTAIVDVKTLGAVLNRAERYGYIDKNPVKAVSLPKCVSSEREAFSLDEIHQLVNAAPNEDWQTLILLGAFTGAQLGDCLLLTWGNVLTEHHVIEYRQQKTGKECRPAGACRSAHPPQPIVRQVGQRPPLSFAGREEPVGQARVVGRIQADRPPSWPGPDGCEGEGDRSFAKRTFHSLRHTFSSMLAGHGVSEELRMRLTGHSSRDIHQRYTHHATEALQKAIDAIPAKKG